MKQAPDLSNREASGYKSQYFSARKKVLYLITKATWGSVSWETHGFPIPSSTGKQMFSRPLSSPRPCALLFV